MRGGFFPSFFKNYFWNSLYVMSSDMVIYYLNQAASISHKNPYAGLI